MQSIHGQRGFAVWIILLAVALVSVVGVVLATGSDSEKGHTARPANAALAGAVLAKGAELVQAASLAMTDGISPAEISIVTLLTTSTTPELPQGVFADVVGSWAAEITTVGQVSGSAGIVKISGLDNAVCADIDHRTLGLTSIPAVTSFADSNFKVACVAMDGVNVFYAVFSENGAESPSGGSADATKQARELWNSIVSVRNQALAFIGTSPKAVINQPAMTNPEYYSGYTNLDLALPASWPGGNIATNQSYSPTGGWTSPLSNTELAMSQLTSEQCALIAGEGGIPIFTAVVSSGGASGCYLAPTEVGAFSEMDAGMQLNMGWTNSTKAEVEALISAGARNSGNQPVDSTDPSTVFMKKAPGPNSGTIYMQIDSHQIP